MEPSSIEELIDSHTMKHNLNMLVRLNITATLRVFQLEIWDEFYVFSRSHLAKEIGHFAPKSVPQVLYGTIVAVAIWERDPGRDIWGSHIFVTRS